MPHHQEAEVLPLPELPQSQQGTSTASSGNYTASVSNAAGYLCHIQLECRLDVSPEVVFEIFSHPDNAGAFRDIKKVGYRKVIESSPGFKRVEVEQVGELRVMWVCRSFRTYLDVTEDARDPECLKTDFTLLRSDILSRFHGAWELRPVRDAAGQVVACDALLTQDVLPRGVPSFFARLPVLGGLLRQVSLGAIKRLVEDLLYIVKQYKAGCGRLSVGEALIKVASERGHRTVLDENRPDRLSDSEGEDASAAAAARSNGSSAKASNVTSFAVDDFSDSEDLSSEGSAGGAAQQQDRRSSSSSTQGGEGGSSGSKAPDGDTKQKQGQAVAAAAAVAAAGAAAAAVGGAAAVPGQQQQQQQGSGAGGGSSSKHRHKKHSAAQQAEHGEVGVMLDVSQHGHVSVALIPGDV